MKSGAKGYLQENQCESIESAKDDFHIHDLNVSHGEGNRRYLVTKLDLMVSSWDTWSNCQTLAMSERDRRAETKFDTVVPQDPPFSSLITSSQMSLNWNMAFQ